MEQPDNHVKALVSLHSGLERQGPGDADFSEFIIRQIPGLPPDPRIADLGCGTGAGTLILAERFHSRVKAVDFSRDFLEQLMERARQRGLEGFVETIECDIGSLDWDPGSIDLLWSEGAAYSITFEGALAAWRPLLADNGIAVISEMNYFSDDVAEAIKQSLKNVYPGIKAESTNVELINASGFEVLGVHRLPSAAWWDNYYDPLRKKISAIKSSSDKVMQAVIAETEQEMAFFEAYQNDCGYTYFVMRARGRAPGD